LVALASVAACLMPAAAGASTTTFPYTGAERTYTVPAGVREVSINAIGAAGGTGVLPGQTYPGGRGAIVSGVVDVTPGETVYVEVGGMGANPAGGFNGGGNGTVGAGASWVGGGGASDVRTLPMSAGVTSLNSRLIVAGGGGGAPNAGDAGQSGVAAFAGGGAGTQTSGGAGGCPASQLGCGGNGTLGQGGEGGYSGTGADQRFGGGGGGGLYGGGGGGADLTVVGGGGGGSSLVPVGGTMTVASLTTPSSVSIAPVPLPTCEGMTTNTPYRQAVTVQLRCTEFAAKPLTYAIVTAPGHGELSGDVASGRVTYTPAAGFSGQDRFTYDASSTNGTSSAVTVSIAVAPRSVARAGRAHGSKTDVKIPVRCHVDGVGKGPHCNVIVTISTNGVKVGETSSPTDTCLACRRATVAIGAGDTRVINIPLDRKGKDLLAARGKLPVSVVVTQTMSATKSLVSRQRLVL
jgi:hypothetical protein